MRSIREQVGSDRVILGLSGGVDSSVVAALCSKAIGKQLVCVFVNHGLLRKNEPEEVEEVFTNSSTWISFMFMRKSAMQSCWMA